MRLPLWIAAASMLSILAPPRIAHAHGVTVDGSASDWSSRTPTSDNLGLVARNAMSEGEYVWLDNTGVASGKITCVAPQTTDALPFEFRDERGALQIATTFRYNRADDSWIWTIDNVENGHPSRFADLTMRRR